ncbi:hypothetical protein DOY81_002044, partial [Sarcophaga bullata]
ATRAAFSSRLCDPCKTFKFSEEHVFVENGGGGVAVAVIVTADVVVIVADEVGAGSTSGKGDVGFELLIDFEIGLNWEAEVERSCIVGGFLLLLLQQPQMKRVFFLPHSIAN